MRVLNTSVPPSTQGERINSAGLDIRNGLNGTYNNSRFNISGLYEDSLPKENIQTSKPRPGTEYVAVKPEDLAQMSPEERKEFFNKIDPKNAAVMAQQFDDLIKQEGKITSILVPNEESKKVGFADSLKSQQKVGFVDNYVNRNSGKTNKGY